MDDKEKLEQLKEGVLKPDEKLQKFDDAGLTDDYLIGKLKDQCEAESEFEVKISKKESKIIKKPLWKIQQDAVKEANKLKGNYPAEKHEHTGDVIFHSNVPEPDMPEEEDKPASEDKNYNPKPSAEEMETHLNEWIDGKPPPPPPPEEEDTLHVTDMSTGGTGTFTNIPTETTDTKKEPEDTKDHHRSRRESGK